MGLLGKIFGNKRNASEIPNEYAWKNLPTSLVAEGLEQVSVRTDETRIEVDLTIKKNFEGAENEKWRTGIALDCSTSMADWYGQGLRGTIPENVKQLYIRQGLITETETDGQKKVYYWQPNAYEQAIEEGHLQRTENIAQPLVRKFSAQVADQLDENGNTTVLYFACGNGREIETLGNLTGRQCRNQVFVGLKDRPFGEVTCLVPALEYFIERQGDSKRSLFFFITDGRIDDLEAVEERTRDLCHRIEAGTQSPLECVLIGVGDRIEVEQMSHLRNLETDTNVSLWDYRIVKDMENLSVVFSRVVEDYRIVAPEAALLDTYGNRIKAFPNGMPARVRFALPNTSDSFEIEAGGERILQSILNACK